MDKARLVTEQVLFCIVLLCFKSDFVYAGRATTESSLVFLIFVKHTTQVAGNEPGVR